MRRADKLTTFVCRLCEIWVPQLTGNLRTWNRPVTWITLPFNWHCNYNTTFRDYVTKHRTTHFLTLYTVQILAVSRPVYRYRQITIVSWLHQQTVYENWPNGVPFSADIYFLISNFLCSECFILSFGRFPRRLNFKYRRFGALCLLYLRMRRGTDRVFRNVDT